MANPQKENGYTAIANEIIDELVKTSLLGAELQVCLFIIRKTYGYGKKEDAISITQFETAINKSRPTIVKALKNLQLVNMVELVKIGDSKNSSNIYKFNKNHDTWKLVRTCQLVKKNNLTSKASAKKLVKACKHTKESTKENTKERECDFLLPENIKKETWEAYLEMRKTIKKPATLHAQNLIIKKLLKMGDDPNLILEQSIENSYQGVFPLKTGGTSGTNTNRGNRNQKVYSEQDRIADEINAEYYRRKAAETTNNPTGNT